jgi:hypothetical protein
MNKFDMDIFCYELYKNDWIDRYLNYDKKNNLIKDFYNYKKKNPKNSFNDFKNELNFDFYLSFEDFLKGPFLDEAYMKSLFMNDDLYLEYQDYLLDFYQNL